MNNGCHPSNDFHPGYLFDGRVVHIALCLKCLYRTDEPIANQNGDKASVDWSQAQRFISIADPIPGVSIWVNGIELTVVKHYGRLHAGVGDVITISGPPGRGSATLPGMGDQKESW